VCVCSEGDRPGLSPEDFQASVATLRSITTKLGLECVELRQRNAEEGTVAEFLLRQRLDAEDFMEVR
jgi:GTPase